MQCYVVSLLVYDLELHESTPSVDGSSQQTNRHSASPAPSPGINKKEVTQKMVCLSWLHKKRFLNCFVDARNFIHSIQAAV